MNQVEKKQKRLKHLCSKYSYPSTIPGVEFSLDKRLELFRSFNKISLQTPRIREEIELLILFKELGYSDKQAHLFWFKVYLEREKMGYRFGDIKLTKDYFSKSLTVGQNQ